MDKQMKKTTDILDFLPSLEDISKAFIPVNISMDMVNAIPQNVFKPDAKFLDIACRDGRFLKDIMHRLMRSEYMQSGIIYGRDNQPYNLAVEDERRNYILREQLFGLALYKSTLNIARRNLYGTLDTDIENIIWVKEYQVLVNRKDYMFGDTNIYKIIKELLGKKESSDMKIDVVIGNPPYNKGMDLDFVELGYKLSSNITCMITPAKWQTAEADQKISSNMSYGQFRQELVPHMSHVCYYPNCADLFEIKELSGISYFIMDKQLHEKCKIVNKCNTQIYFNSVEERNIHNMESLHNIGNEIVNYLGCYKRFEFPYILNQRFLVCTDKQLTCDRGKKGTYQSYGFTSAATGKATVLSLSRIVDSHDKIEMDLLPNVSTFTFGSDDMKECESFVSWLNSKFTRFFVAINISKLSGVDNHTFRFVPAPPSGKFDHIYTDEELYKTFNLPQKYIDVIEAVINERK